MKGRMPELVLVLVTAIWGGTFLATRVALGGIRRVGWLHGRSS